MELDLLRDIQSDLIKICGSIEGTDSDDREYTDIISFWTAELNKRSNNELQWYSDAYSYWENEAKCKISDDGVLAGFGFLTPMDTKDSNLFLDWLKKNRPELSFDKAADCGAGIGRVTKNLLLPRFSSVDMIEQSPRLLGAAPEYIGEGNNRVCYINVGLQHFSPESAYDVIWIQWVVGHLTDPDYVSFFRRCAHGLRPGGIIVLKDNCSERSTFMVDREDSSVARHVDYHQILFAKAGLKVLKARRQKDFPKQLCPVIMFALVPQDV